MRTLLLCGAVLTLVCACNQESADDAAKRELHPQSYTDENLARGAAAVLVKEFSSDLRAELMAAAKGGNFAEAINVCQQKAPEVAAAHSTEHWSIRRVSDRNRNPSNEANEAELAVLADFADDGTGAPEYVDVWTETNSGRVYYYYKPIRTSQLCLKCHGGADDIDSRVKASLRDHYPSDKATGYGTDELRGMFVVTAIWPDGKSHAYSLLDSTGN